MADAAQAGCWPLLTLLGVVAGARQRKGKAYWPAALLMGLALGTQGVFWLALLPLFGGDVAALRAWAAATRAGLWANGAGIALLLWAWWLVERVNRARPGSAIDPAGHLSPPLPEQVEEALHVIARADRHDLLNREQRRLLEEERLTRAARARARGRP